MNKKGVEFAWWQVALMIILLLLLLWYILFATGLRSRMIELLKNMFNFLP